MIFLGKDCPRKLPVQCWPTLHQGCFIMNISEMGHSKQTLEDKADLELEDKADLELLDKLQKPICRTVGPSLAASLEPLAHRQNVASLSLFYRYYFGRCSSEPAQLVPLPYCQGRSTHYSDRLHALTFLCFLFL